MILYRYVISILGGRRKVVGSLMRCYNKGAFLMKQKNGNYSYFSNTIANDDDVICEAAVGMSIKSLKCKTH